jgi:hypothetical protein
MPDDDEVREDAGHRHDHTEPWTALRADVLQLEHNTAWGLALRSNGRKDSAITAEARWTDSRPWMGRFGGAVDVFGEGPIDLRFGILAGHIGDWQTAEHQRFSVGTSVDIGWHPGRFNLEHRHMGGKRPDARGFRTEGHTMIGFRPLKRLEIYADFAVIDPGGARDMGAGFGAGWRF